MHDDSVLVAIEAALAHPASCGCGSNLTVRVHDGGAWLECSTLARPSRLPRPLAGIVRSLHDQRLIVEVREPAATPA